MTSDHDEAVTIIHTLVVGEDGEAANQAQKPNTNWGLDRGTALGRYIILDKIGTGGMSAIYAAYDPELDRKVAIKLLHPDSDGSQSTESSATSRTRLLREAQAMAKLSHPNVVRVFDVGTWEGEVFIAMEVIEGGSLKAWLAERDRSWSEVKDIMIQAARGLAAAHAAGLVHRDFKPENLLISRETGRAYVVDFGLVHPDQRHDPSASVSAEELEADSHSKTGAHELANENDTMKTSELTQLGTIMGTPPYMAPEQHRGERTEPRTDQFCYCVTLFEAIYGERPFKGKTLAELRTQVLSGKVNFPEGRKAPLWVQRIVRRGLSVEIGDRYPSMDTLIDELSRDPVARRRKVFAISMAVTSLVAGAIAYPQLKTEPVIPCLDSPDKLKGVWDGAQKQALKARFDESDAPFAKNAWASVEGFLDNYTQEWVNTHKEACEATEVRGEQSDELKARRTRCLDRYLSDLGALAEEVKNGDDEVLARATGAFHNLGLLSNCSDAQALSAIDALPGDAITREDLKSTWKEISQVRALVATGQYWEALPMAQDVVQDAVDLEYYPTIADAYLELGRIQFALGDYRQATNGFNEALWASEASHYDRVAAVAATHLVESKGRYIADGPGVEHLVEHAEATIERHGSDIDLRHRILGARLDLALARGRDYLAEQLLPDLLKLDVDLRKSGDSGAQDLLFEVAEVLVRGGEPDRARQLYEAGIKTIQEQLGADHPLIAKALAGMGRIALAQGNNEAALKDLSEAIRLVSQYRDPELRRHETAELSFDYARALWNSGKDLAAATEQAMYAQTLLKYDWSRDQATYAEINEWLLTHPGL